MKGMSMIDVGEHLATHAGTQKKGELQDTYEAAEGNPPPARWARLDLIIGIIALICKR